ncbi:aminoacyl-tRNA hydrolase [bacterium]|nr:aminoacyl-tRNA hydrolase [bacterium]
MIEINKNIAIPDEELVFSASRSSGPGGQNVNKVSTRMTVRFNVIDSTVFTGEQKQRILERLATRANKEGVIRVASQRHRTQNANREEAAERLASLIREALKNKPVRRKTKKPLWVREQRLEVKKHRSLLKEQRKKMV